MEDWIANILWDTMCMRMLEIGRHNEAKSVVNAAVQN